MIPNLGTVILDGASRHRLDKGFILTRDGGSLPAEQGVVERVVADADEALARSAELRGMRAVVRGPEGAVVGLVTPFLPVYNFDTREAFMSRLAAAARLLARAAERFGCRLTASGVNPYEGSSRPAALCADLHQIEVYDDGEIERIYNLFRQFLPELLAISANSSVYGGQIQKDFSLRMRVNPASFLPRYLSQFTAEQLGRLERAARRDYGIADVRLMDVNPLGGDVPVPASGGEGGAAAPLLGERAPAVELRFIDAQCSFPFIRAQVLLLQAIAMYGRALSRRGRRLPFMRDGVVDENKALAIQSGALAVLKPDPGFKQEAGRRGRWFHDVGSPERATSSLLCIMEERLLPPLQDIGCRPGELEPILLGAELRRRGKRCLANYGEYQQYVFYTEPGRFAATYQQHLDELLVSHVRDSLSEYNRRTYPELADEIGREWARRLAPHRRPARANARAEHRLRIRGRVKWFDAEKGFGGIEAEGGSAVHIHQSDVEGGGSLRSGQRLSFEVVEDARGPRAVRARREAENGEVDV